ncbi:MAG TPA: hypothetical protein VF713_04795 [Thermoanaerobaculia bacterium]
MRRLARVLLIAATVCALPLSAETLRVSAPQAGTPLHGGSFATLQWTAGALQPHAEEWEAFLSIDGGKYYAFRITPHLDIDRRRFDFAVPNVDTNDARILIRTGDEKRESLFELPERFSIVRDANAEQLLPEVPQFGRGESARDGDAAVISWADGERNGSGVTQRSTTTVPSTSLGSRNTVTSYAPVVLAPATHSVAAPSIASARLSARGTLARNAGPIPLSVDLLLVCRRRNI